MIREPAGQRGQWDFSTPSQLSRCHCTWKFQWTVGFVQINRSHVDVVRRFMEFGVVVAQVFGSGVPLDIELLAGDLVCDPEVSHFHRTGTLALNGVVGNAGGGGVVAVEGCGWLWVAEFLEDEANDAAFFGIDKEGAQFGLGGGGSDEFEDGADDVDGTIEFYG